MGPRTTVDEQQQVTTVDRWFRLTEPVRVDAGQTYWIDVTAGELCVDRGAGKVTRHAGWMCR